MYYQQKPQKLWLKPVLVIVGATIFIITVGLLTNWGDPITLYTHSPSPTPTSTTSPPPIVEPTSTPWPISELPSTPAPRPSDHSDWVKISQDNHGASIWVREDAPDATSDFCPFIWSNGRGCAGKQIQVWIDLNLEWEQYFINLYGDGPAAFRVKAGEIITIQIPEDINHVAFGNLPNQ